MGALTKVQKVLTEYQSTQVFQPCPGPIAMLDSQALLESQAITTNTSVPKKNFQLKKGNTEPLRRSLSNQLIGTLLKTQ